MRHFLLSLLLTTFLAATLSPVSAQMPRMFSYQGVVLDASGHFISNDKHNILIKLYDAVDATSPIYSENQTEILFVNGLFNVMVGSKTPIPSSVTFSKGYFLGVAVDGGNEMNPRTAVSPAPYAMYAVTAGGLLPGAKGVVSSVNNQDGAITLQAGAGTIITNSGSTISISSTGVGGTGIQGVQNGDASISVTNPTGPVASVSIANGGITSSKIAANAVGYVQIAGNAVGTASIADAAVTPAKINAFGSTNGQVLTSNGTSVAWQSMGGGLTLPYAGSVNQASDALSITNQGSGSAIAGIRSGTTGTNAAIRGESNSTDANALAVHGVITSATPGNGSAAVRGENKGTSSPGIGVYGSQAGSGYGVYGSTPDGVGVNGTATNNGTGVVGQSTNGRAGVFSISGSSNSSDVLDVSTSGTGKAADLSISNTSNSATVLSSATSGTGISGNFGNTNTGNTNPTLQAINASTNSNAIAVYGEITSSTSGQNNIAAAIRGAHLGTNGIGSGVWGSHGGGGDGVYGSTATGHGVEGSCSGNGVALYGRFAGSSASGTALQIDNGYIKVSGGTKTAYVHATNVNNCVANRTFLNYPGMAASDIVIAIHSLTANAFKKIIAGIQEGISYGVWWNVVNLRWEIYLEDQITNMPVGETFNVLVIKQ
jgi:hypothetical protein